MPATVHQLRRHREPLAGTRHWIAGRQCDPVFSAPALSALREYFDPVLRTGRRLAPLGGRWRMLRRADRHAARKPPVNGDPLVQALIEVDAQRDRFIDAFWASRKQYDLTRHPPSPPRLADATRSLVMLAAPLPPEIDAVVPLALDEAELLDAAAGALASALPDRSPVGPFDRDGTK